MWKRLYRHCWSQQYAGLISYLNFEIVLLSKLKVYHLSYCTCEKGSIDIADPSNMLDSCHIWTLKWSCSPQRLSGRASECRIQRSEVWFLLAAWWLRIFSLSNACKDYFFGNVWWKIQTLFKETHLMRSWDRRVKRLTAYKTFSSIYNIFLN